MAPTSQQNDHTTLSKPPKITKDQRVRAQAPPQNDQNTLVKIPKISKEHMVVKAHTLKQNDQNNHIIQDDVVAKSHTPQQNDQKTLSESPKTTPKHVVARAHIPRQNDQTTLVRSPQITQQNVQNTLSSPPENDQVAVVMVPFPAQGHLNQLLHLARLLLLHRPDLPVHYLSSPTHNRQAALRAHGWDPQSGPTIHFQDLPLPQFPTPNPKPPNPTSTTKFPSHLQPLFDSLHHLRRPLASSLRLLASSSRRVIVIHDSMMSSIVHHATITTKNNIETYNFHSVSSFAIHLFLSEEHNNNNNVTSCNKNNVPPDLEGCFSGEFREYVARQYEVPRGHVGSVFNTCREVEGEYVERVEEAAGRRTWALGPLNPVIVTSTTTTGRRHVTLEWLDGKEVDSVIYVSFGTTTTMEEEQLEELALGLERSQHNFIWVLRAADKGDVFLETTPIDKCNYNPTLPQGFEDRVKGRGLVVRDWAPQLEILAHPSTGGFMSHCGWNSAMEALTMGLPVAAWPMHSDQPRNTWLLARVLRVAIPVVEDWARRREIVPAAAVEGVVRRVMASGGEARRRAAGIGAALRRAAEKGGASWLEMEAFVEHITRS